MKSKKGQTLVILLVFMAVMITVTTAAVIVIVTNSLTTARQHNGMVALYIAESGAENALMRLLRDPSYTGENNLVVGSGFVDTTVTGTITSKTITATGKLNGFYRQVQVVVSYTNNVLAVSSWQEKY